MWVQEYLVNNSVVLVVVNKTDAYQTGATDDIVHVYDDGSMCRTPSVYKQFFGRSVQYVQIESAINEALAAIEPQAFLCS